MTTPVTITAFSFPALNQSAIVGSTNGCGLGTAAGAFLTNSSNPLNLTASILQQVALCPGTSSPLSMIPGLSVTWNGNSTSNVTATYNGQAIASTLTRTLNIECSKIASLGIQPCNTAATRQITTSSATWIWLLVILLVIILVVWFFYSQGHY